MILVDSSVWIHHLRYDEPQLLRWLGERQVLCHPFVVGELAAGSIKDRNVFLTMLQDLPHSIQAGDDEVLAFIDRHRLHSLGLGYLDLHLLTSVALTAGARIWTRDRRMLKAAELLNIAAEIPKPH